MFRFWEYAMEHNLQPNFLVGLLIKVIKENIDLIHGTQNTLFTHGGKTFLDNEHIPFTFSGEGYDVCRKAIKRTEWNSVRPFSEVFAPMSLEGYNRIEMDWHYNISTWDGYSRFIGSQHNLECARPKYLVQHKWYGLVKDH